MFDQTLKALLALPLLLGACAAGEGTDTAASTGGELEVAQAPAAPHGQARVERRLERMREHLELDDAQVDLMRPILERHAEQRRAARQQFRDDLAGVLTPEQLEQFDARVERRGKRGRHGRHGRHRRGFRRLVEQLALTDAQKEQVRPILEGLRARRQELRDLPREERRAAAEAMHGEIRAQLVPILDAEQLAKLDDFVERVRNRRERRRAR